MKPIAAAPCVLVVFGASGDLTRRKIIPALFDLFQRGQTPKGLTVLGVSRTEMSDDDFRGHLREWAQRFATRFTEDEWTRFARTIHYCAADGTEPEAYQQISSDIDRASTEHDSGNNILFYLSVAPQLYERIIECINQSGLVTEGKRWCSINRDAAPWQRIIVEKPFGVDLRSAQSLNRALGRAFEEESIYRIDHYLGKELVQNLLVLRFANTIFEPLWNRRYIHHVQITAAEKVGVESRGSFYDRAGALRDMIQSHLMQVLALVAMEPPGRYADTHIRREKIKVSDCIRVVTPQEAPLRCALGQYGPGLGGQVAYRDIKGVAPESTTETFAAIRLDIDNWRWSGVPFFLRTGKAMARKLTEVVLTFREPPIDLFSPICEGEPDCVRRPPNRLIINIQPDEGISLRFEGKIPGAMRIDSIKLDFDYLARFGGEPIEAYGPLLLDAMRGDQTLFKHRDEVEGAWSAVMPFLDPDLRRDIAGNYAPGSWGPRESEDLLAKSGCAWHNPSDEETR
ncbi:MAG: glucose-6-phosphate dehydrogenase [Phycisphaerales bacterium]|nr:glucose-6-phosphate dehydrogenase [Phycisphaerales bacterium]